MQLTRDMEKMQEAHEKDISDLKKTHLRDISELTRRFSTNIDQNSGAVLGVNTVMHLLEMTEKEDYRRERQRRDRSNSASKPAAKQPHPTVTEGIEVDSVEDISRT